MDWGGRALVFRADLGGYGHACLAGATEMSQKGRAGQKHHTLEEEGKEPGAGNDLLEGLSIRSLQSSLRASGKALLNLFLIKGGVSVKGKGLWMGTATAEVEGGG